MNFEQEKLAYDEIEVSISAVIKNCIKQIKWIIVLVIVFAIALPSVKYIQDANNYKAAIQSIDNVSVTEEQNKNIQEYFNLKMSVQHLEDYRANAPIMRLNPSNVYFGELQYFVHGEENVKRNVISYLKNYLEGQAFTDIFSEEVAVEATYLNELIKIDFIDENSSMLSMQIMTEDEEACKTYVECINNIILDKCQELKTVLGEHEISLIQSDISVGYSYDVYEKQKDSKEELQEFRTLLANHTLNLSEIEKKAIVKVDDTSASLVVVQPPLFNYKYIAIGAILGGGIGVVIVTLCTIYSGNLQTDKELYKRLGMTHLGTIFKKERNPEQVEVLATKIEKIVDLRRTKQVYMISTQNIVNNVQLEKVSSLLGTKQIQCVYLGNPLLDKETIEKISNMIPVVIAEKVGKSKVKDVYAETSQCKDLGVEVLGYIAIVE